MIVLSQRAKLLVVNWSLPVVFTGNLIEEISGNLKKKSGNIRKFPSLKTDISILVMEALS